MRCSWVARPGGGDGAACRKTAAYGHRAGAGVAAQEVVGGFGGLGLVVSGPVPLVDFAEPVRFAEVGDGRSKDREHKKDKRPKGCPPRNRWQSAFLGAGRGSILRSIAWSVNWSQFLEN